MSKEVTYQQYRDAAYRYNAATEKMIREEKELEEAKESLEKKREELKQVESLITHNRTQRNAFLEEETTIYRQQWTEQKNEVDRAVDEEIRRINAEASERIKKQTKEYKAKKAGIDNIVRPYYNRVENYKNEIVELNRKKESIGDFTKDIPVGNKKVLSFLVRARKKKLFTRNQGELLDTPCDVIINNRREFRSFADVTNAEKNLASCDWYKRLEKGDVTESVRMKTASVVSGAVIFLFFLFLAFFFFAGLPGAVKIVQVILMMLAMGGFTSNFVNFVIVKMFFQDKSEYWKSIVNFLSVIAGMALGTVLWIAFYKSSTGTRFILLLLSMASTFFLCRKTFVSYVRLDTLGKIGLLRDLTRKEILRELEPSRDNIRFLQMYCYLNHTAVINYVAMIYRDHLHNKIEEDLEVAQNCLTVAKRDLNAHNKELKQLLMLKKENDQKKDAIEADRVNAVAEAEEKRLTEMPDFTQMLSESVLSEINSFDNEYETLQTQRTVIEQECIADDDIVLHKRALSLAARDRVNELKTVLFGWDLSPDPLETEYHFSDILCFESAENISIIKHNLEPFVFWYQAKCVNSSPANSLNKILCRCIRGLKKINPQALMQINIIDCVSNRQEIIEYSEYSSLCSDGITTYIKSTDRHELRLIDNKDSFKMLRALFISQCYDIRDFFNSHKDMITDDTERSLAGANQLKNDVNEPFVYQIMLYVVPRANDINVTEPPKEIVQAMKDDICVSMGVIPFFFADMDSVHEKWREAVDLCRWSCTIGRKRKR